MSLVVCPAGLARKKKNDNNREKTANVIAEIFRPVVANCN